MNISKKIIKMYDFRKQIINNLAVLGVARSQFCKKYRIDAANLSRYLSGENTLGAEKIQQILNYLEAEKAKLKRFEITFLLSNGNRIDCRVEAMNGEAAIKRLEKEPVFLQMLGNESILQSTLKEISPLKISPENYVLQPSEDAGWWVLTDTKNLIVCKFHEGNFNNTQTFKRLFDSSDVDELEHATIMRQFSEYLIAYHKELL